MEKLPSSERAQLLGLIGAEAEDALTPEDLNIPVQDNAPSAKKDRSATETNDCEVPQENISSLTEPELQSRQNRDKILLLQSKLKSLTYHTMLELDRTEMKKLMGENLTMKQKAKSLETAQTETAKQNRMLGQNLETLRGLAASLIKDARLARTQDDKAARLLEQLELDTILGESQPPAEFPVPEPINDKSATVLRGEVERLQKELKGRELECRDSAAKFAKLDADYQALSVQKRVMEKNYSTKVSQLKSQLIGAIRRINYLLEEKRRTSQDSTKRSGYTARLELECVRSKENAKTLVTKIRCLTQKDRKLDKLPQKEFSRVSEWSADAPGEGSATARSSTGRKMKALRRNSIESIREIDREIRRAQDELEQAQTQGHDTMHAQTQEKPAVEVQQIQAVATTAEGEEESSMDQQIAHYYAEMEKIETQQAEARS